MACSKIMPHEPPVQAYAHATEGSQVRGYSDHAKAKACRRFAGRTVDVAGAEAAAGRETKGAINTERETPASASRRCIRTSREN
jgi:hypothetical protein